MESLINFIVSLINGVIVGVMSFVLGVLDSLDNLDSLLEHAVSSISGFFSSVLTLGNHLFPFVPAEWMAILESMLIVIAIGIIIKKKVAE